ALLGAACRETGEKQTASEQLPSGAPPAFGTAPPVGPDVSARTFAEAGKLLNVELTEAERNQAAANWRKSMAPLYERRTGLRKVAIDAATSPYSRWDPVLPGKTAGPSRDQFRWSRIDPGPLPSSDDDIALAPLTRLA